MNGKSPATAAGWPKSDTHIIQEDEYDELPEWTDEMFDAAEIRDGGKLVRNGLSLDMRSVTSRNTSQIGSKINAVSVTAPSQ
ncbi:MAG: hypothetical protein HQM04_02770 [Magnetococcales bacterium]|nr:hypothetical protein [Magnetococcales bacterium]MBF0113945.1 hypothetical protein [Magnetococcales bacterium]